jgi:hypothetical protein
MLTYVIQETQTRTQRDPIPVSFFRNSRTISLPLSELETIPELPEISLPPPPPPKSNLLCLYL